MKRWTSISTTTEDHRWQLLSRRLQELGADNEYVPWTTEAGDFSDIGLLEDFDHVRLSSRIGPQVVQHLKVQSSWTTLLGVIDGMVRGDYGWWPLCALYESFGQLLIQFGQHIDTRGSVLVAGAGGTGRAAIAAFFKAGFRKFLVVNFKEDEAHQMIADVQRRFFGLELIWVPTEHIVLLPGETTVLVNCTPSVEENQLMVELSYLNFLRRPGFLFDLNRNKKPGLLISEAMDAGVTAVTGVDIGARADVLWAKWAFQRDLDLESYAREFSSILV